MTSVRSLWLKEMTPKLVVRVSMWPSAPLALRTVAVVLAGSGTLAVSSMRAISPSAP